MAILQDLDSDEAIYPESVWDLRLATDLALHATKQTARSIGHAMAAIVVTERHLWLKLYGIREMDK